VWYRTDGINLDSAEAIDKYIFSNGNRNVNHHLTLEIFCFSKTEIQNFYKEMKTLILTMV
jgi:hypothetical protein